MFWRRKMKQAETRRFCLMFQDKIMLRTIFATSSPGPHSMLRYEMNDFPPWKWVPSTQHWKGSGGARWWASVSFIYFFMLKKRCVETHDYFSEKNIKSMKFQQQFIKCMMFFPLPAWKSTICQEDYYLKHWVGYGDE